MQLCSQSSNKSGVMQRIIENEIDKTRLGKLQEMSQHRSEMHNRSSLGALGCQGRFKVETKRKLDEQVTSTTFPRDPFGSLFGIRVSLGRPLEVKMVLWRRIHLTSVLGLDFD